MRRRRGLSFANELPLQHLGKQRIDQNSPGARSLFGAAQDRFRKFHGRLHRDVLPFILAAISPNSSRESQADHCTAIAIFPKCAALSMRRKAAGASANGNTASTTGLSPAKPIASFIARNCFREPT